MTRRHFLQSLIAAGVVSALGPQVCSALEAAAAPDQDTLSADMHSHSWRQNGYADRMKRGELNVAVMSAVSDRPLVKLENGRLRAFGNAAPGVLHDGGLRQIADIKRSAQRESLVTLLQPADASVARAAGKQGIVLAFEGGDVLEGSVERVEEIYREGIRLLQLVHYRVNELGDIQTEEPVHNGLTAFGADVVRACNKLGIIVDLAHATPEVTLQALKVSNRPVLLSHTYLIAAPRRNSRGVTRDHARAVAEGGGVIGVVPFPSVFPTFEQYVDGIAKMIDTVGVEHVGIASDMAGIPVGTPPFNNYEQLPAIAQALAAKGYAAAEVRKVIGGNFMRLFRAAAGET
jgi:membrane dipeptidase